MPKRLIGSNWGQQPCVYLLSTESLAAKQCGQCQGEFSLWNGSRYCVFCGYCFHRNNCTSKVSVSDQFFKQRVCSTCQQYRTSATQLKLGEEFECMMSSSPGSTSTVHLSLCEDTAELILFWKAQGLKESIDLMNVEVRKGFSHTARIIHHSSGEGEYEPLRSFSLFLTDSVGEQNTCHLKAPSALICQLWVEGLKASRYVYQKILEQDIAAEYYQKKESGGEEKKWWHRSLYLPVPESPSPTIPTASEEWDNIPCPKTTSTPSEGCGFTVSAIFPFPPSSSHTSSGYLSDLSCSLHSLPHSALNNNNSHTRHTSTTKRGTNSLPPTPGLPPSPTTCHCHTRTRVTESWFGTWRLHSNNNRATGNKCCDNCRSYCRLAAELSAP